MLIFREAESMLRIPESFVSQFLHVVSFTLQKPEIELPKGMVIISIDIDAGSRLLGLVNNGKNDSNVHDCLSEYAVGRIEERALPLFLDLFDELEVPVTFGLRGQLLDVDSSPIELLLGSSIRHDIGAHGYSHRRFETLSPSEAKNELNMVSATMKKFNIQPISFIFPRNSVAYLNLLEEFGYKCYRCLGNFILDRMRIEKKGDLYNINPSLCLNRSRNSLFLERIIDVAAEKKAPFHVWFHLWNFGKTKESVQRSIDRVISPMLRYAWQKIDSDLLTFETMSSAAMKVESEHKPVKVS